MGGVATLIFNNTALNFENSVLRPNGSLLVTTITAGELLDIDLTVAPPEASLVATFDGAGILGISAVGYDKYAIAGGIPAEGFGTWTNESIYTIDLSTASEEIAPVVAVTIPGAELLDGLTALPAHPHLLLVSDALAGVIYRVDLDTGGYTIAVNDTILAGNPGVNGIKVLDGHAYFVNTETSEFGRFRITESGERAGDIEIIATEAGSDDFALAADGTAYMGNQSSPYNVYRVFPNGTKESVASNAVMGRPCSLNLASDGVTGYVTTASGQVFKWEVPSSE